MCCGKGDATDTQAGNLCRLRLLVRRPGGLLSMGLAKERVSGSWRLAWGCTPPRLGTGGRRPPPAALTLRGRLPQLLEDLSPHSRRCGTRPITKVNVEGPSEGELQLGHRGALPELPSGLVRAVASLSSPPEAEQRPQPQAQVGCS